MTRSRLVLLLGVALLAAAVLVGGCSLEATPSVAPSATASPTQTEARTAAPTQAPTESPTESPTPAPTLSLEISDDSDGREISVSVMPAVAPDGGGEITVTVTSNAAERIDELVLRWPTDLDQTLFLAPFIPDPNLGTEGGGNLVRPWTKWVIGPGERGEPAGTTSLGYGPIEPGETLTIPLYATRIAPGSVSFDLQVLVGEDILTLAGGEPAELRVEVP